MGAAASEAVRRTGEWARRMPGEQWEVYRPVLESAIAAGLPFAMGGGMAFSFYSMMWRNTKDLDLYMQERDVPAAVEILSRHGFDDFYDRGPYDRGWIYRSVKGELIIDVIWTMPNRRAAVDRTWVTAGPQTRVLGVPLRMLPAEELVFAKLYVLQRHRCDWPDLLNVLHGAVTEPLDWDRLLERLDDDRPLLAALLTVFAWLCPSRAALVPAAVWERLSLPTPTGEGPDCGDPRRAGLLESRPWFAPIERGGEREEIV